MPAGTSVAISDAVGRQAVTISKAGLRCSGNDLRPAVRPTVRNPGQDTSLGLSGRAGVRFEYEHEHELMLEAGRRRVILI